MTDRLMYGPVEGETTVGVVGTIRPGGAGNVTGFDGMTFWGAAESLLDSSKTVKSLEVGSLMGGSYHLRILYTDNTSAYLAQQHLSASQLLTYGITAVSNPSSGTIDDIDLTPILGPSGTYTATKITKFYGPIETAVVTGVTGTVRAGSPGIGAGIQFDGAVFWNKVGNVVDANKTMDYLQQRVGHGGDSHYLTLFYTDGTSYAFENGGDVNEELYGITYTGAPDYSGFDYIELTATTVSTSLSKEIKKLYGSVNGQAKIIHQGFGHLDYS